MSDRTMRFVGTLSIFTLTSLAAAERGAVNPVDYRPIIGRLERAVSEEMTRYNIRGITVALVEDQRVVHLAGYGTVAADSIFRAGSISKLLNAVAVMQLVEQGKLDLDAPLDRYWPNLIVVPFESAPPLTLRHLLSHRSGMIRESPVGGYLDDSAPSLRATIESVRGTALVNPPGTKTRYSNVGPSVAGQVVAMVSGLDYEQYQQSYVLKPLEMKDSSFVLRSVPRSRLAKSYLRVANEQGGFDTIQSPLFDLGTQPAGNLFTTAGDLARFIMMLAAEGRAGEKQILRPETLRQMFTAQAPNETNSFGLGFSVSRFRGHLAVSHMGAVYGFTSALMFLPEARLGVVVLSNEDIVTGRIRRLAHLAMSLMLERKLGEKPDAGQAAIVLAADELRAFAGDYESQSFWAQLEVREAQLAAKISGQSLWLRPTGPLSFLAEGRLESETPVTFRRDAQGSVAGFTMGPQQFRRIDLARCPPIPTAWHPYRGSYGPKFIPLIVRERYGHLYAMTENMIEYRLTPLNRQVFAMPLGLYTDEHLVFMTDAKNQVRAANLANMLLKRR